MDDSEQEKPRNTSQVSGTLLDGKPDGQSHSDIIAVLVVLIIVILLLLLLLVVTCMIKTKQHQTLRKNIKARFKRGNRNSQQSEMNTSIEMSIPSSSIRSSRNSNRILMNSSKNSKGISSVYSSKNSKGISSVYSSKNSKEISSVYSSKNSKEISSVHSSKNSKEISSVHSSKNSKEISAHSSKNSNMISVSHRTTLDSGIKSYGSGSNIIGKSLFSRSVTSDQSLDVVEDKIDKFLQMKSTVNKSMQTINTGECDFTVDKIQPSSCHATGIPHSRSHSLRSIEVGTSKAALDQKRYDNELEEEEPFLYTIGCFKRTASQKSNAEDNEPLILELKEMDDETRRMNNREEVNDEPTKEVVSSIAESIDQAKPSLTSSTSYPDLNTRLLHHIYHVNTASNFWSSEAQPPSHSLREETYTRTNQGKPNTNTETMKRNEKSRRNIYEKLRQIEWVKGYYCEDQSIQVDVNLESFDPQDIESQLAEMTGASADRFHVRID